MSGSLTAARADDPEPEQRSLERARSSGERPGVIYVMGAGRSGSTTLGITLGNCANVFYGGELDNWLVRSGVPQVKDGQREEFWGRVRNELGDAEGAAALFGNESQRAIERSLAVFRLQKLAARRRLRPRYRAVAEDLYRAVTRAAGVTHVADTSHYPLRARELQSLEGIDLYLVFLVRDPQSVVASFNRQDVREYTKSTLHTNVYLLLTHILSALVFLRHPRDRRLLVHYQDFLDDPAAVVRQILSVSGSSAGLPDFTSLKIGFPLQGNRVSRSQTMSLKSRTDPLPSRSRLTSVCQAPMMFVLSRLRPATEASPAEQPAAAATAGEWRSP